MKWQVKKFKPDFRKPSRRLVLIVSIIILGISLAVFLIYQNTHKKSEQAKKKVDCTELSRNVDELLSQSKYQEARDKLQPNAAECKLTEKVDGLEEGLKVEKKVVSIKQIRDSAVKAYTAGDVKQAKVYAEQAIKARNDLTPDEFKKISGQIPNLSSVLLDVYAIQDGSYRVQKSNFVDTTEKTWE